MDNNNFYDYNRSDPYCTPKQNSNYTPPPQPSGMSTASLVLGIIAMALSCCLYLSIPLGALGIIFAILSKGHSRKMTGRAKTGLGLSIGSICLSFLLIVTTIAAVGLANLTRQARDYMDYYYGDYYDQEDLDRMFGDYFNDYEEEERSPRGQYDLGDTI